MLVIRFARLGKRKNPFYRIIISEKTKDTQSDFLEILGYYNPLTKVAEVKKERILYWLSCGAKPSPTVYNLLVDQNIISGSKVKASKSKRKKKEGVEEEKKGKGEKKENKEKRAKEEEKSEK